MASHVRAALQVEELEYRLSPAIVPPTGDGSVATTFSQGTLRLVGDAGNNVVLISQTGPGQFQVTGNGTAITGTGNFSNVKHLVIQLNDGNDGVFMDQSPITLSGNLTIAGGAGNNQASASNLIVKKALRITNAAGNDTNHLANFDVGRLTISNGPGNSDTRLQSSTGFNRVGGTLTLTNGTGQDFNLILDTNIGGNLLINNGLGVAGATNINQVQNAANNTEQAVIGGRVSIKALDPAGADQNQLADVDIFGSVNVRTAGTAVTTLANAHVTLPPLIRGNLSIVGTGESEVNLGTGVISTIPKGLVVRGSLSVSLGGNDDAINAFEMDVLGQTSIQAGAGDNSVSISHCLFLRSFTAGSADGADTFSVQNQTTGSTEFLGSVRVNLGAGDDQSQLGRTGQGQVQLFRAATFQGGEGTDTLLDQNVQALLVSAVFASFEI